jgi:energy-coupling factor transporter ATP-binding protein EcfA2
MAWVKSIEIDGLAGRDYSFTIEFNRSLNVLWGVNGCGKTSLLRIIHSALQNDAEILTRTPFTSASVVFESDTGGPVFTRVYEAVSRSKARKMDEAEIVDAINDDVAYDPVADVNYRRALAESRKSIQWKTTPTRNRMSSNSFSHRFLPISRVASSDGRTATRPYPYDRSQILDEATIDRHFVNEMQRLWRDYSIRESQAISSIQREGIAEILNSIVEQDSSSGLGYLPMESIDSVYSIIRTFFDSQRIPFELGTSGQFAESYKRNQTLRRVAHKVVEIQSSTLEVSEPRRRAEQLISELFSGSKKLRLGPREIEVIARNARIPVQHLSSGERQMLRMLIECLAVGKNCILIDEPELSMHVDWQIRLINSMRSVNPDAQIIAATHSPEVMAEIADESIFELTV